MTSCELSCGQGWPFSQLLPGQPQRPHCLGPYCPCADSQPLPGWLQSPGTKPPLQRQPPAYSHVWCLAETNDNLHKMYPLQGDCFSTLPSEVQFAVLKLMSSDSLGALLATSKHFHQLVKGFVSSIKIREGRDVVAGCMSDALTSGPVRLLQTTLQRLFVGACPACNTWTSAATTSAQQQQSSLSQLVCCLSPP